MFPSRKLGRTSRTSTVRLMTEEVRQHAKDKPCNCSYRPSGEVSGVSCAIGMDTHFVLGNGKSMRISSVNDIETKSASCTRYLPRPRPCHGESSEVRDAEGLCYVVPCHSTGTFHEDICTLTCLPRGFQKIVDPPSELPSAQCRPQRRYVVVLPSSPPLLGRQL